LLQTVQGRAYILATTVFLAGVVSCQIGNAFACRTSRGRVGGLGYFSNRGLLLSIALAVALLLTLIYVPIFNNLFELLPLPPDFWAFLAFFGPVVYLLERTRKILLRRGDVSRSRKTVSPAGSLPPGG
jgi:magnesium-transporting ATPase (P-type)